MESAVETKAPMSLPARRGRIRALHPRFQLWASFGAYSTVAISPGRGAAGFSSWMAGIALRFWADQSRTQQDSEDDGVDRRLL
jgi:hypothetical protein